MVLVFLLWGSLGFAKGPELSPQDVRAKMSEILKAHATFTALTPEIAERMLKNYLEECDPSKTYFLKEEVSEYLNPSPELLGQVLQDCKDASFTSFYEIHNRLVFAIERRNQIEKTIQTKELPLHVTSEEFKHADWVANQEELKVRLLRVKALQLEASLKIDPDSRDKFFQRIEKRRLNREAELLGLLLEDLQRIFQLKYKEPESFSTFYFKDLIPQGLYPCMSSCQQLLFGQLLCAASLKKVWGDSETYFPPLCFAQTVKPSLLEESLSYEEVEKIVLSQILKAFAASLDAHTTYFTPQEANQFMIQVQQRLFGIGAQLRDDLDGLTVTRILENSPASRSNLLKINDKIIAVNREPVIGMDISEAVELIRGEKNTPVRLTVLREGKEAKTLDTIEIELVRNEIILEDSRLETTLEPFGEGVIVTLHLFSFYQDQTHSAALDIQTALQQIQETHTIVGVLLDLRGNSGGLLSQAVAVTGLFIQTGVVASIKDQGGKLQHLRVLESNPAWEGPLFVLVNRASASAAEIVAQTLQDYGRALILGDDHTFGKGSFQTFTLDAVHHPKVNPQGEYKVTRGIYYTVSGKSPQLIGVQSDMKIPGLLSELEIGEKYAKYPLDNDQIEPHFKDDLSDLSLFHRLQLGAAYKNHLQPKQDLYSPYLETLKKNADMRMNASKPYQNCLQEIRNNCYDSPFVEFFQQSDLQLHVASQAMKDLLTLHQTREK